jgi:hypothetical protein
LLCATASILAVGDSAFATQPPQPVQGSTEHVSKRGFGKAWPLTVKSGTLLCETLGPGAYAVSFVDNKFNFYAINGTARAHGTDDYPIERIWKKAKNGVRVNMTPLLQTGLALCEHPAIRRR